MSDYSPFQPWSAASPFALALGIAALVCVLIALVAWPRRTRPGGAYLAVMMSAAAWWALLHGLELTTPTVAGKVFWLKLEYMGIVMVPLAWLLFAWDYAGHVRRLDRRLVTGLCGIAVLTVLIAVTNELHVLFWTGISVSTTGSTIVEAGPWFWINTGYAYILLAAGSVLLLRSAVRHPRSYRGQGLLLVVAIAIPWAGNTFSLLWLSTDWVDITPFAFVATGLILMVAVARWRLFNLLPVLVPLARMRAL